MLDPQTTRRRRGEYERRGGTNETKGVRSPRNINLLKTKPSITRLVAALNSFG